MAWPKGKPRPPLAGRKAGTPNKQTKEVRDAVMESFIRLGGATYLEEVGRTNIQAYCQLLGKILPHEFATSAGPLKAEVLLRWMTPQMAANRGFIDVIEEPAEPNETKPNETKPPGTD
jgi:hypothetical protein